MTVLQAAQLMEGALIAPGRFPNLPLLPELDAITRLARELTGAAHAAVNLFDAGHQFQLTSTDDGWTVSPRADSMCATVADTGRPLCVRNAAEQQQFIDNPWVDGRRGRVRLYASAPLLRGAVTEGALCVWDELPGDLSASQASRLEDLAALVVAVMGWHKATVDSQDAHAGLLHAHEALVRQRAFTDALLEALPVGVVAADVNRRVTLFNQVSRRWHGQDTDRRVAPQDLAGTYDLFAADGMTPPAPRPSPVAQSIQ